MARPLRFQYPGAIYHVMARGDGGKFIFNDDVDAALFLKWLGEVCESHGWRVHAWVLMGNHFHLLLETPEANLVSGMKRLLGAFAQAWNRRYQRHGHVFQGRYKSVPVSGELASHGAQFRVVADYIHLNPARAKLTGAKKGPLVDYPWSSLPHFSRGKGPDWLIRDRVLSAFALAKNGRGRRAYVAYLEERAKTDRGKLSPEAMKALRRGWYLGSESFRDTLLELVQNKKGAKSKTQNLSPDTMKSHSEKQAQEIIIIGTKILELNLTEKGVELRKGDPRKVAIACVIKKRTHVTNQWIATKLDMGHDRSVSRLIRKAQTETPIKKMSKQLEKMLQCED